MQKKKQRKLDETITNRPIVRKVERGTEPFKGDLNPTFIKYEVNTIDTLESALKEIYLHNKVDKSFYGELKCNEYEKF